MTIVPATVMNELNALASESGDLAGKLHKLQRAFEPIEEEHDNFVSDFVTGLWAQHCDGKAKWPGEEVRLMLARQAMPPDLYGRYTAHKKSIDRIRTRMRSLRLEADARRSILSALKEEMQAAR